MKPVGILVFPGTQCDRDTQKAFLLVGVQAEFLWYQDQFDYKKFSALVLPGGFSYGDYLRSGALAARSPALKSVQEADQAGWPILGICNGFQILCETGLLPGVLVPNTKMRFIDQWVELNLEQSSSYWLKNKMKNPVFPIAHSEGRYFIPSDQLEELEQNKQIWLTYKNNPNGSVGNIAGVMNKRKNTAGLMPHPERAMQDWMFSNDGVHFFKSFCQ